MAAASASASAGVASTPYGKNPRSAFRGVSTTISTGSPGRLTRTVTTYCPKFLRKKRNEALTKKRVMMMAKRKMQYQALLYARARAVAKAKALAFA